MPNDYRSRNQADVKGCQKLPATAKSQGHMWKNTPQGCQRGYNPVNTFISDFWPTELVQFSSVSQWCPTLCDQMDCSMLGFPVLQQLPELAQTHVHQVDDPIQPSNPLSSPSPPAFIRVFSNQAVLCIRWPKYQSFSFSFSPSNEYSGLISFRIDWFDLLTVQGLSRVLSNTILQKHQFFRSQLSLWYNSPIHI